MTKPTVIITGASRGLGRATALMLARMGASVTLNARSASALQSVRQEVEAAGGQAMILAGDISHPEVAEKLVTVAVETFGGVDALINNAGVLAPLARIADSDPELWLRNLAVNVFAPFLLTQAALPYLRKATHGRVVNISSGAAVRAVAGWSAYCASKAAVNQFTAVLAREEPTITAVALRPGVIDTAMQRALREDGKAVMSPEMHEHFSGLYEQGALLPPEAPAEVVATLALRAPRAWSGRFISWNEADIQQLLTQK